MKRLICILLCVATCFACSLTAFAGGPITEEDAIATQNTESIAAPQALADGLKLGTTYKIRSMASSASNPFVLNVPGGADGNGKKIDMWTPDQDDRNDQKFRLIASGSYYKLIAMCSSSGRVLDAFRPLTSGCSVDIWDNENDDAAQQLSITGSSSGYVIRLASNSTLALTAVSLSNGGAVQFQTYTGSTNQKWGFDVQSTMSLPRQPDPDGQNKSKWCWAAAAKMVAEHNGGVNSQILRSSKLLDNQAGVHESFYGIDSSGRLTADGVQRAIVEHVKSTDKDITGDDYDKEKALEFAAANSVTVDSKGSAGTMLTDDLIAMINTELLNNKYVIGNVCDQFGKNGHSIVIKAYKQANTQANSSYVIFDPWNREESTVPYYKLFDAHEFSYLDGLWGRIDWFQYCH